MAQLYTLFENKSVRVTNETPPRVSAIDVVSVITDKDFRHASEVILDLKDKYEDVRNFPNFKFAGRGQRKTPVVDLEGMLKLIHIIPGMRMGSFRLECIPTLMQYLFPNEWTENDKQFAILSYFRTLPISDSHQRTESSVRDRLAERLGGYVEVNLDSGRADIVTATQVIEVKTVSAWKHAMGQVQAYGDEMDWLEMRIHLYGTRPDLDKHLALAKRACLKRRIIITHEVVETE